MVSSARHGAPEMQRAVWIIFTLACLWAIPAAGQTKPSDLQTSVNGIVWNGTQTVTGQQLENLFNQTISIFNTWVAPLASGQSTVSGTCPSGDLFYNNSGVLGCQTPPYLVGAKGDGRIITPTASIAGSSPTLTTTTSSFTSADVGKTIVVAHAGVAPTTGPVMAQPVVTPGSGYTSVPTCAFTDASSSGSSATCSALMTLQSATVVSGGATCTNGTFVFMASIDGTGTAAQITGTVSGGILSGVLTVTSPGLLTAFGTLSGASIYGANCATAPTVNLSYGVGAVQVTAEGSAYSTTQTTGALSGGSPSVAATLGTTAIGAPIPPLVTTVSAFVSTTQVTLAATASTTISAAATQLLIATDDSAAFQAAINAGSGIKIPPGIYWIGSVLDPGSNDLTIAGSGMNNTILVFDNGTSTSQDSGAWYPLFKNTSGTAPNWKGSLEFEDFQIRGLLDFGRVNVGAASTELNNYLELRFDRMKWYQISWMAQQNESANRYSVIDSTFDTVMRDQARCRSCAQFTVKGSVFRHSDDDSVNDHQASYLNSPGQVRQSVVVEGNLFEDTDAVHILGARQTVVRGNTCRRAKIQCVSVSFSSNEGIDQMYGIDISDNIATDTLAREFIGNASGVFQLQVEPPSAPAGATNFVPGAMIKGTGYIGRPYDFDLNNVVAGTQLAGPARGVSIHDNRVLRTLPATSSYAAWGYGQTLTNFGFYDLPVPDSSQRVGEGILASANFSELNIHDNDIQDVGYCIIFGDTVGIPETSSIHINNNHCFDTILGGISAYGSGSLRAFDFIGNDIDMDPYQMSAGRSGSTGAWTSGYSPASCFTNFYNAVVQMIGNTFSNCYSIGQNSTWRILHNNVRGAPYSGTTGQPNTWSGANQGLGVFPTFAGNMFFLNNVISNPSSGNTPSQWGSINNTHVSYAAAAPSSGYHVIGDIIWSSAPQTCTCLGWQALTTGSSWTHGTDYDIIPIN